MDKKEKTPLTFKAKVGDFEKEYEFVIHKFQIPGIGELTSEEALENAQALAELIERKSTVIKEISSVEVSAQEAEAQAKAEEAAKAAQEAEAQAKAEEAAKAAQEAEAIAKAEEAAEAPAEEKASPKKKGGK